MTVFTPSRAEDVLAAVQWAVGEDAPLEILGHGSKRGIGRPVQTEHTLDLSGLSGVTLYEPEELVLSARAGTPVAEIEALLAEKRQQLAFEPLDYGPLFGAPAGRGTIGGVLAGNLAGPRRLKAGAARDHVLGIHAVSGRGEAFKSGGRVVKNVTGYDLSKAMAGSWGTLAVVTDTTFKVLPAAETETTLVLRGLSDADAATAMAAAMGSAGEVSGAAHLPESVTGSVIAGALAGEASTLLRLEGFGPSVAYRRDMLTSLFKGGEIETLEDQASRVLWREIRDVAPFCDATERPVWRVSVPPTRGHALVMALRMQAAADAFYDWQGGLVWLRMESEPEADIVRALVAAHGGGHATLVRAAPAWRSSVPVFQPQPMPLAALSARLKNQFDPQNVLNPGRMYPAGSSASLETQD
ncbi:glycolate oxidase subunit GlcE [Nitratireductor sp. CAU 1489]|uniref:Glycolate oxidase subunit GlcE n=1 Tax=Nitratireductor arenosus TaxID=2682096 RepID=A0A844QNS1_9HYPH|nr:glycolate oxidase subunit GlcE [Nitratireductor arenosus]MVA99600.1 glycolate oxidase subunit GlcE [Nitratireductor arenosus]